MMNVFKIVFLIVLVITLGFIIWSLVLYFQHTSGGEINWQTKQIEISGQQLEVAIADTKRKRVKGLSNRSSLPLDHGILFVGMEPTRLPVLDESQMHFATDIIWLSDFVVIGWTTDIKPQPDYLHPELDQPMNGFLEVNAGLVDKWGVKIGEKLRLAGELTE